MDKSLQDFGKEIAQFMPRFLREVLKRQSKTLSAGEITIPQVVILNILKEKQSCKMKEIAKLLSVTTSAATGIIDRMVKSDFVKRVADEKDRRIINIKMTQKGRKIIDDIQEKRYKMMMNIFKRFKPIERERYLNTIKKIHSILSKEGK